MDHEYWMAAVEHLSILDKEFNELYAREKKAFTSYVVSCYEIAEAKYHGYLTLLRDGLTGEEEERIENEYKEKLNALFQERQNIIGQISSIQTELFDITKRTLPLESYKEAVT